MEHQIERLAAHALREATTLPTTTGETVKQFMRALGDAARVAIKGKYGEKMYVSTSDTDGTSAIFNVWCYGDDVSIDTYLRLDYMREASTGVFTFSNPVEMQRVTSFEEAPEGQLQLGVTTAAATIEALAAADVPCALDIAQAAIALGESRAPDRAELKAKLEEQAARVPASDPYLSDMFSNLRAV